MNQELYNQIQGIAPKAFVTHDDMQGNPLTINAGSAALTYEYFADVTNYVKAFMRHDQDDYIGFDFQFSHRKKLGTILDSIHLHYIPMVVPDTNQNVYFGYKYCWTKNGDAVPANASWITGNSTLTIPSTTTLHKTSIHSILANISPPANESYSSILRLVFYRLGTDVLDTYTTNKATGGTAQANLCIDFIDVHFQTAKDGSVNEITD